MAKKILIVEDNVQDAKIIKRNLNKNGYEELIFASTGEEGLAKAKSEKPDMIILDINLPQMSGVQVHITLKNDPSTKHIPVLFITNLMKPGDDYEDPNKFLSKSAPLEDLIKAIKTTLER
ncbi:MAG: response regulator [Candidatus Omnitrophota bacterium]|nr:response regulator [Candidatus Omnitrophota bacterium]